MRYIKIWRKYPYTFAIIHLGLLSIYVDNYLRYGLQELLDMLSFTFALIFTISVFRLLFLHWEGRI